MIALYEKYKVLIYLILNIMGIALSLYFYINRKKERWFSYYWKGFALLFVGVMITLLEFTLSFPTMFTIIRKIITLKCAGIGFYLVIIGAKIQKSNQNKPVP